MQRKPEVRGHAATAPPSVAGVLGSTGAPLPADTRAFFEQRFEHDFSRVRVYTDARAAESARAVAARAYTVGQQIVFGTGQYAPNSRAGRRLLAHELAHTIQQQHASTPSRQLDALPVADAADPLEAAADRMADLALTGESPKTKPAARTTNAAHNAAPALYRQAAPQGPLPAGARSD